MSRRQHAHHKAQGLHVQSPGVDHADEVGFALLHAQRGVRAACTQVLSSDCLLLKGKQQQPSCRVIWRFAACSSSDSKPHISCMTWLPMTLQLMQAGRMSSLLRPQL